LSKSRDDPSSPRPLPNKSIYSKRNSLNSNNVNNNMNVNNISTNISGTIKKGRIIKGNELENDWNLAKAKNKIFFEDAEDETKNI